MSVIIRLQNLPWSASSVDIRKFFEGLSIPEGGVHIVGGELGDAFIAFSTDEDARQAFERNNRPLKQVQIKLALSSRTEMQKVIEEARTKPFLQSVQQVSQLTQSLNNKMPITPQAPVVVSTQKDKQNSPRREDLKDKDTRSRNRDRDDSKSRDRDDSKNRRDRSRRRTKSRSRSRERRDRSRDRRDRRRRDRSRSKDRRDSRDNRRRDNRRSKSRERDRSRDRDGRRSSDRRRSDLKLNEVIEIKDDIPNSAPRIWEQKPNMPNELGIQGGILGNFPGQNMDDARRNLGIMPVGMQSNLIGNQMNRFPRNDPNNCQGGRDNNWQHRKGRFHEGNNEHISPLLNPFQHGMRPNMMGNIGGDMRPHLFQHNQHGMRMPFNHNQDNGFNLNRPFLARPGTVFPENFRSQDHPHQFGMQQDRNDDFRNQRHENIENCCIQVRPYFGGYGEIRKFFGGIFISNTGVKFVMNEFGKRTGIVFIKFVRSEGKEQALQRSGFLLRGVPVEVKHLDDDDWERCGGVDNINTDDDPNESRNEEGRNSPRSESKQTSTSFLHAVVDDIPEFVKERDILKMFSNFEIISVHIVINKQYRHLAYVQFSKEEDLTNALADKTSHVISGKPVSVRPISEETFKEVERKHTNGELIDTSFDSNMASSSPHDSEFARNGDESDSHIITDCVVLNGLPPKTTDRDVLDFFSDIGIVPLKIHIMHTQFGPSGDAYCEFKSCDDAICALDKNDMPLGAGTIRVELVYRRDMDQALGIPAGPPLLAQPMSGPRFPPNRFGPRGGPNMLGPRGPPHMMRRRPPPNMNMRYDGPIDGMGPQGCVVSMENVPFKAGVHEILDFFDGFELEGHNVLRRFNDNGAPTGDARVTFNSADQARRAVEECNRLKIRDRTIFLRLL